MALALAINTMHRGNGVLVEVWWVVASGSNEARYVRSQSRRWRWSRLFRYRLYHRFPHFLHALGVLLFHQFLILLQHR